MKKQRKDRCAEKPKSEEMLVRLEAEKEGKRIAAIKAKWGDDYQSRVAEFKQKALDMEDPDKKEWDFAVKND